MSPDEARRRLSRVSSPGFVACSDAEHTSGWSGEGTGTVIVVTVSEEDETLIFHEKGHWTNDAGTRMGFTNVFRWTFPAGQQAIRLEHLRFGSAKPVYLFDLIPDSDDSFVSISPHVCREDCYAATLRFESDAIRLDWRVEGPTKKELIAYRYA